MHEHNEGKWFFQGESTEPRAGSGQGRSKRSYETFTELINELYPICLDIGISPGLFHESTIDELIDLIKYVDEINLKYGATTAITNPYTPKVREIEKKAIAVGLKLLRANVRHIGTEDNLEILKRIYEDNATIRRYLIEYGFLDRSKDCSKYWVKE